MVNNTHFNNLDILRGIAALLVVYSHAASRGFVTWFNSGSVGVAIFFSLSGFLMGYLYSKQKINLGTVHKYIVSRFARIAPAYLFVVLISYLIYTYIDPAFVYNIDNENLLRHLLLSGNVSVLWSIPPEVQFYLFFIIIWLSVQKFYKSKFVIISLFFLIFIAMFSLKDIVPGTLLPSKFHLFFFGCIAGMLRATVVFGNVVIDKFFAYMIAIAIIIFGIFIQAINEKIIFNSIIYSIACAFCVLILSFTNYKRNDFSFLTVHLRKVGKISFSLYLLHEIILHQLQRVGVDLGILLNSVLIYVLCIFISNLSYLYIEKPFSLRIKENLNV